MLMKLAKPQFGFTLIEMMVVVAILAIIFSMALPSYRVWIENTRIRNAADSIQNGLQKAKTEALQRNTRIQFRMTTTDSKWEVGCLNANATCPAVIDSRKTTDSSTTLVTAKTPAAATTVTFNGLGSRIAPNPINPEINSISVDNTSISASDSRNLNVTIGSGGSIRLCDPNLSSSDPRGC
jgi:type IV fimbrial biogenesis protein FimT